MTMLVRSTGLLLPICLVAIHCAAQEPKNRDSVDARHAAMGIMVGELTSTSALVQLRLTGSDGLVDGDVPGAVGVVEFSLRRENEDSSDDATSAESEARTVVVEAPTDGDHIARAAFDRLAPDTRYVCTTRIGADSGSLRDGPTARFRTLPGAEIARRVRFVVVTGMNYARFHGDDRNDRERIGYPALKSILDSKPDFFVGTGDNVYYDTPKNPRAATIDQMRRKWHEQFVQSRYRELFAQVPAFWEIDDHDYRVDDCDNTGDYEPSPELGRRVMLEQLPIAPFDDSRAKTYRTHRVSRDLQIWLTENRMHRSPNRTPDGPDKSIWGDEQKAWLKRTLSESDATFKLLISPTPMIGPDDLRKKDNHTNVGGFRYERDEFFAWLGETGLAERNFYVVCGDRHWQYHSVHPTGIEEFSCGALVDANSRLGREPGDPQSTDPDAEIKQPYRQSEASGGFLAITVDPGSGPGQAELTFTFHDEHGETLHQHVKKDKAGS